MLTLAMYALPAAASDLTVVNLGDSGPGSLRQAVIDANDQSGADSIHFAPGLVGTIVLTSGELNITGNLVIDGPGAEGLFISGNLQSRIFRISGGATVAIAGLTITSGMATAPSDGGGILNASSTLTLDRVVLANNQAVSSIASAAGRGGAVANVMGAALTVNNCIFTQNRAVGGPRNRGNGGAICSDASWLLVSCSQFVSNEAIGGFGGGPALGGGVSNQFAAAAIINDSSLIGNRAIAGNGTGAIGVARGGGIFNNAAALEVRDCIIEDNLARAGSNVSGSGPFVGTAFGGGMQSADGASLILAGSTIRGNQSIGGDGNIGSSAKSFVGAAFGGGLNNTTTAAISDCLFEDNETRGGDGNRGSGAGFQFVGTGIGGGINSNAGDTTGAPVNFNGTGLTLLGNRALGGTGNTFGAIANAGIGGGLASNGSNVNLPVSTGSVMTLQDCTIERNLALGGGGGHGLGGGIANFLGAMVNVSGGAFAHNRAQGGEGTTAGAGMGGGIYNGPASTHPSNPGAPTVLNVAAATVASNKSQGGIGAGGGSGGPAEGGGLWNGSVATILDTGISRNQALGGDGTDSGDGLGGGAYNATAANLQVARCTVTENRANGGEPDPGGIEGEGMGGGVYILGIFGFDPLSVIVLNRASTSHDNMFVMP